MSNETSSKVQANHLKRNAFLYVRQSSLRQVAENTESTKRQYALRQRAIALGWTHEQVIVVDSDLGQSGASTDREGFQKLVTEVGMSRAGIVMGLEVSRLARNSTDWHRLLEICALTDTLILDEEGIYDPSHFNDRLLLGLKGTMSEAELHMIRARLMGGILNKARRGELRVPLPIGFVYDSTGRVVIDPDQQVQQAVRVFFETFRRTGAAYATIRAFREQALMFPYRVNHGLNQGDVVFKQLELPRALWLLHNPRYAGAFCYGRSRQRKGGGGRRRRLPREEWINLIPNAHEGYITWEDFERNQVVLKENSAAHGGGRRKTPPREGPALLQGLVICGKCGERMTVSYQQRQGRVLPAYSCYRDVLRGNVACQYIQGEAIDEAIGKLVVEAVSPIALELTLTVQRELETRFDEADALRHKQVERAQYEVDLARHRYMRVDPDNRLVADSLEAEWNGKLRGLAQEQEEYARQRERDQVVLDDEKRSRILALATDIPALWNDPTTPDRERKRVVRQLIEDVTLIKGNEITAQVRFRGGATRTLTVARALPSYRLAQYPPEIVAEIDRLLDEHTDAEIAAILRNRGFRTYRGKVPDSHMIKYVRAAYHLKDRRERMRQAGFLTGVEIARMLSVSEGTVKRWRRMGLLRARAHDANSTYLYEPLGQDAPVKHQGKRSSIKVESQKTEGVQCEA